MPTINFKSLTKCFKQASNKHLNIRNLWANTVSRVFCEMKKKKQSEHLSDIDPLRELSFFFTHFCT